MFRNRRSWAEFSVLVSDVVMMGRCGKMGFFPSKRSWSWCSIIRTRWLVRFGTSPMVSQVVRKNVFFSTSNGSRRYCIIDEPFTGVDVKTENAIIELLRNLREEGHLVLVSAHHLGSVLSLWPRYFDQLNRVRQWSNWNNIYTENLNTHSVLPPSAYRVLIFMMMTIHAHCHYWRWTCRLLWSSRRTHSSAPKPAQTGRLAMQIYPYNLWI